MKPHIDYRPGLLRLLDQRILPHDETWIECRTSAEAAKAIRDMVIRGAPAIGITAAYGMALAAHNNERLAEAAETLLAARPTAVNLAWAVARTVDLAPEAVEAVAMAIHASDTRINQALGAVGTELLPADSAIYTHCNAGALATGGWGTALGVARSAHASGKLRRVWAGETRPYLQGARLTAWECEQEGIPCTLVTDSMAASVFAAGEIDAVVVGADRVAANGDVANKIGTLGLAILAKHYNIPFYVAVPTSTLDAESPTGSEIPIEQRHPDEVRGFGSQRWAADVDIHNPAFDITPAHLVTAWITENGLWNPSSER